MARRLPTLKSVHPRLRLLIGARRVVGMLHFYLEPLPSPPSGQDDDGPRLLALAIEACLRSQLGQGFREEDLLARGGDGEWFVFLASPRQCRQDPTRRDLQEIERRVARELRSRLRDALPQAQRTDLPSLRSGSAVLDYDPDVPLGVQLDAARYEARVHGRVSRLMDDQISGLNHKIRTPLTTVKGVIEIIRHDPDAAPRFLSALEHEVDRIHSLLDQFSLLARIDSGIYDWPMQDVDLSELVRKAVATMQGLARTHHVDLAQRGPAHGEGLQVWACVELVEVALRQLIDNAVRHGFRGGQVTITLGETDSHVTVDVSDLGPGIPEEDLPHIFQPFYGVGADPDTHAQGGGLGLCLARGVMEAHGGEIACASRAGRGTTITLRFPRTPAEGAVPRASDQRTGASE